MSENEYSTSLERLVSLFLSQTGGFSAASLSCVCRKEDVIRRVCSWTQVWMLS